MTDAESQSAADTDPVRRSRPRWIALVVVMALGVFAALVVGEIALRALGLPKPGRDFLVEHRGPQIPTVDDPDTFWRLDERSDVFVVNRLGLRGLCPPAGPKEDGEFRIVCVGDSSTFGFGHPRFEMAYGMRLGRTVQQAFPKIRVDVTLAALPAFSSYQNRVQFERDIVDLAPDLTILYCGAWNDIMAAVGWNDRQRGHPFRQLRLVKLFAKARDAVQTPSDVERFVRERPFGARVPEADFVENLETMIDAARAVGSSVVVMPPPHAPDFESDLALRYRALAHEVGVQRGTRIFDAAAWLRAAEAAMGAGPDGGAEGDGPGRKHGPLFDDKIHPSVLGHRVLAEGLWNVIQPIVEASSAARSAQDLGAGTVTIRPAVIPLFMTTPIVVDTTWSLDRRDTVWVGDRIAPRFQPENNAALSILTAGIERPGVYPVDLVSARGLVRASTPLEVGSPRPTVTRVAIGESGGGLEIAGPAPSGWLIRAWCGARVSSEAFGTTPYGQFELAHQRGAEILDLATVKLPFVDHQGPVGAAGTFRCVLEAPADEKALWIQVAYFDGEDPTRGVLSEAVPVPPISR